MMEDNQIIDLYFERDEQALKETQDKYQLYCKNISFNILQNHEESEECFNDTLLKTWYSIPPHRPSYLKLYLAKIIRNCSLDVFQKNHAQKRGEYESPLVFDELEECIGEESVEVNFHQNQLKEMINHFLHQLPEKECDIFIRRYFYFDSTQEIAHRYQIKESHVYVILSRTREKLKDYLKKGGYFS